MNEATANLWKLAESLRIGAQYTEATRNADPAVRAAFKADREIAGTKAWGICKCMGLATANFSEDEAAAITAAITA